MRIEVLAILMVAFCLFAILMFVLFYIYAKKTHNEKMYSDDYVALDDAVDNDINDEIELVDIMINGEYYVFDANNYQLVDNESVELDINGNTFNGIVTKGNYKDSLSNYNQIPTKLILNEIKESIFDEYDSDNYSEQVADNDIDDEIIPKKKNNN